MMYIASCTHTYALLLLLGTWDHYFLLNVQFFNQNRYSLVIKSYTLILYKLSIFTATFSDINALREELIIEFRAVKLEVEASHLDIMDSVRLAMAMCKVEHST